VNGLSGELLTNNPNGANPSRLSHSQVLTCDQDHDYTPEQAALDSGLVDRYPQNTEVESCTAPDQAPPHLVLDYYDGNTVTGLWNYAQYFALSDDSFDTEFGPSTPGAIDLVSGETHGVSPSVLSGVTDHGTVYGDADPGYDDCSSGPTITMSGRNVGDLLNAAGVTWGWFQGGFAPSSRTSSGDAICASAHDNIGGVSEVDYSAHHEPFEYYASTSNPHHLAPATEAEIGHNGRANHQYDLSLFSTALSDGNLPAVSFLKAARYQDGHAGYSDPLDEQHFLVSTINDIQRSQYWDSTAVIIAYDDSDGWYDHVMPPIINPSASAEDDLQASGKCGRGTPMQGYEERCGYGVRLPLLVISPYAKDNYIDNVVSDQTSILRFIEVNWHLGCICDGSYDAAASNLFSMFQFSRPARPIRLILNPTTGEVDSREGG
jgi:phospholipase C